MTRGADAVMRALAAQGVRDIFALSGNQIMPLFDASIDAGIRLYHTRHEAAAVYMAEGYAQITGGVGVALVTAGAGLGNAIGPLLTARASDTPVLLLSGDSPVSRDGQGAFQEMGQVALTASLTKWSVRATRAEDIGATIHAAVRVAMEGRPGPVHVSLPADVLLAAAQVADTPVVPDAPPPDIADLREWLDRADRPVIVMGPALTRTRASGLAERLEQTTGAPVVDMESPRGIKDPALGGFAAVMAEADRVLLLGKPLDFTLQFGAVAPCAEWAVINGDAAEIDRARRTRDLRLGHAVAADPAAVAQGLARGNARARNAGWRHRVTAACAKRLPLCESGNIIHPRALCAEAQAIVEAAADPVIVCDGGEFGQWAQAGLAAPRRIINGVSGAIGGGLCYAMAARAADPTATVLAFMGDGTAGFHLAEFETAVREDLPFVAIIGNDQRWNAEHQIQLRDFGADRLHGCALSDARYDEAMIALGGFGASVTELHDLKGAIEAAIGSGKPACINVMIEGAPAPDLG
ncbi:MAG TPA: thiamine pyrophosphate-binding protein [Roseovarius sp.]|uniref:thiamine pyrophosphate-binding protein n=1 Tax=Marivita sp. TaxID=2003365 RepID=UPI0025C3BEE8|nr:thiamine pyrophosphate-binding protein [Marivita sp.]HKL44743.1 thiamine pyrophosphate-binding protein [Roseovarius sp.]